jgi:hypothetical protein
MATILGLQWLVHPDTRDIVIRHGCEVFTFGSPRIISRVGPESLIRGRGEMGWSKRHIPANAHGVFLCGFVRQGMVPLSF